MNEVIRRNLIEVERPPRSINQQYEHTTNLNQYWRESKREVEKLRGKKESGNQEQKQTEMMNNKEGFMLHLVLFWVQQRRQKEL